MTNLYETSGIRRERGAWLVVVGFLSVVLGAMGFWMAPGLTSAGVIWYGGMFSLLGGMLVLSALFGVIAERRWLKFLLGAVYLSAGLLIALEPVGAGSLVTLIIGTALVLAGAARALWISRFSGGHKIWGIAGGAVSILLGVLIVLWPLLGIWAIGLFIAVDLVFYGITVGMCGWSMRRAAVPNGADETPPVSP